nr:MAG TPA: hypothetical protein [Caudoviricetes sp.]
MFSAKLELLITCYAKELGCMQPSSFSITEMLSLL